MSEVFIASPPKTFQSKLASAYRYKNALIEQHRILPFTHKADLTFNQSIDERRFRRRLSDLNQSRFHAVFFLEKSKKGRYNHFHIWIRTSEEMPVFEGFIQDALAQRKGQKPSVSYTLNLEPIDPEKIENLATYNAKANARLLKKNQLLAKGKREVFSIGKAWSEPPRKLHQQYWKKEGIVRLRIDTYLQNPDLFYDDVWQFIHQERKKA